MRHLLIAFVCLATATSACALLPCVERQHESGLRMICAEPVKDMPESLKAAASFARELAEQHPDEFGHPWANPDTGDLEVRVTTPRAEPFVREWVEGRATRGSGDKTLPLPRPEVPLKLVTVDRSFRQLREIMDGSIPARDLPDGELIYQTYMDARRNATVIGIDHVSDALLRALAKKYGTSAIVIRVEPNPRFGY